MDDFKRKISAHSAQQLGLSRRRLLQNLAIGAGFSALAPKTVLNGAVAQPISHIIQPKHHTNRLTVVELFTSQGCPSCPNADATLRVMRDKPNVLALSWHVSYWDRFGWADTLAMDSNNDRQMAYNETMMMAGVRTPQFILDGHINSEGADTDGLRSAIANARTTARPNIQPAIAHDDNMLYISLPETKLEAPIIPHLVWYLSNTSVEIGGGVNRGRTIEYANTVCGHEVLDNWSGQSLALTHSAQIGKDTGADHVALLLHTATSKGLGGIMGAAMAKI